MWTDQIHFFIIVFLFLFFVQAKIANDSFELFLYLSDLLDLSL